MNVLITGGTGSFGQAFTERLLKVNEHNIDKIIIYSRDEHKQEQMAKRLAPLDSYNRLRFFIGDIRDKDRLRLAIRDAYFIVHTAALKIVPSAEYNPFEYVKTNIIGSQNIIDCCSETTYPRRVIALSTDKAVAPKNLYGSTKLCMEKMFLAANNIAGATGPKFSVIRYGNVANSNGSVIRVFKDQLSQVEPFTITNERMTRFWITLDEAVKFVYDNMWTEAGKVLIPEMPSFKILDLAKAMGGVEGENIHYVGVRPGEKIHEQIDDDKFSNINDKWLSIIDLKEKLINMGVI